MTKDGEIKALVDEVYAAYERMIDSFTKYQDTVTDLEAAIERLKDGVRKPEKK